MAKKDKIEIGKTYYLYGEYEVKVEKSKSVKDNLYFVKFLTEEGKKYFDGDLLIVNASSLLTEYKPQKPVEEIFKELTIYG